MNLLFYTQKTTWEGFSTGGAETSLQLLAEKLAARGHKVIYLTESERGRLPRYNITERNGVKVHAIGYPDLPSKGLAPLLRLRRLVAEWMFDRAVERIVRSEQIELVHTYHEVPAMHRILALRARKGLRFATVLRMGGLFWTTQIENDPALRMPLEMVFRETDLLMPNTPGLVALFEQAYRAYGLVLPEDPSRMVVHDIGVPVTRFERHWKPKDSRPFTLVMASRLSGHQKRQELLVKAMALLPPDLEAELILVGDGPQSGQLRELARDNGQAHRIRMVPFMEQQALWELLCRCDLYLHACDFEGLSKVIIEAMGMGVPVLASDVVPLNDYIRDGETGFLVENRPEAWAGRIAGLLADPSKRQSVCEPARKTVQEHFDADQNVRRYEQIFQERIESSKG